jgi:formylglycine-generating enzyme required for sulfatase activity
VAKLTVKTDPEDATVSFLNIKQHFSQGMELKPGKYHVEVAARGYQPDRSWITIAAGEDKTVDIQLKKIGNVTTNSIGMKFIFINPGTFEMGSSVKESGGSDDEQRHTVTLSHGYYLQTTEVTVGEFRQFVTATRYITEAEMAGGCWISSVGGGWKKKRDSSWKNSASPGAATRQTDQQPVTCVSWNDAKAFITWLNKKEGKTYSLPTEAEWEYACRAGTTTAFGYGECLSTDQANYGGINPQFSFCKDRFRINRKKPLNVASLAPNPWGLFDMHGNVAEWCDDWYGPYPSSTARDPKGPTSGTDRVLRGCHWMNTASECRSAKRSSFPPSYATDVVGFRVVRKP